MTKQRGCSTGKIRYQDRQSALPVIPAIAPLDLTVARVRAYECHLCLGWHVTTAPPICV